MWTRHFLMVGVALLGLVIVGSQLQKQRLRVDHELAPPSADIHDVVARIDAEFNSAWQSQKLQHARRADHLLVARRLSLALTGTVPSLEEIRAFEKIDEDERIVWWLQHLLTDRRYSDYVAERLARAYVGTENGPFIVFRRRRFVSWLSDELLENRPYDEIVRSLISDRGLWTDSPGINFITVTNDTNEEGQPDPARLAARTTRAFLGVRLDCMQCHDDNLGGDWKQSDFHELASFFAEARTSGLGIQDTDRDYEFTYLDEAESETVSPKVPFADDLLVDAETRRDQLANWVTHKDNQAFARATVNRVWAIMFGRPLSEPIDDIPLEGPYPAGLQMLADDFAENDYDLRRLITEIALTQVFQQDSRADFAVTDEHEQHWTVFPISRLRPEQVAGSIVQSASLPTIDSSSHVLRQFIASTEVSDFVERYGDTGEDEFEDRGGTIPQRLVMLNGELVKERTKDDLFFNAATRIAQQVRDDDKAIESAFLVALTRRPTEVEQEHFVNQLANRDSSRAAAMEDIFWSLLNSTEFCWNH